MPRRVKDARIGTRAARARIAVADSVRSKGHEPHWRAIGEGEHLGYRKGKHGGKWIARYRKHGAYVKKLLGKADDAREADGASVLDYRQDAVRARPMARRFSTTGRTRRARGSLPRRAHLAASTPKPERRSVTPSTPPPAPLRRNRPARPCTGVSWPR
jgi:hypothetical protein